MALGAALGVGGLGATAALQGGGGIGARACALQRRHSVSGERGVGRAVAEDSRLGAVEHARRVASCAQRIELTWRHMGGDLARINGVDPYTGGGLDADYHTGVGGGRPPSM